MLFIIGRYSFLFIGYSDIKYFIHGLLTAFRNNFKTMYYHLLYCLICQWHRHVPCGGVHIAHRFGVLFCFVCFHPVSCVPNVGRVSDLSIRICPFRFLPLTFIYQHITVTHKIKTK